MPDKILIYDKAPDHETGEYNFRVISSVYNISVSAQPNRDELIDLAASKIPPTIKRIWYINLRDEPTFFVDGDPVSVHTGDEIVNAGKDRTDIIKEERELASELQERSTLSIYREIKTPTGKRISESSDSVEFKHVATEEQMLKSVAAQTGAHIVPVRLCVVDHDIPSPEEIDYLVKLVRDEVEEDDAMHFHCRGGKGRSSTLAIMARALCHAKFNKDISDDFIDLKSLAKTSPKSGDSAEIVKLRAELIEKFQQYITSGGYPAMLWTDWVHKHKLSV